MFNVRLAGEMAVHLDVAGDVFDGVLKTPPPPPPPHIQNLPTPMNQVLIFLSALED